MKRFSKPQILRRIGRARLEQFLERFDQDFKTAHLSPPGADLDEPAFFDAVAALLMTPENLPEGLTEALFAIEEMANSEGQERLERAIEEAGLVLPLAAEASHIDIALQIWLAAPELLVRKHNEQRLLRLTAFECFGATTAGETRTSFRFPEPPALAALSASLDLWFCRHHRGEQTVRVQTYPIASEYWFLVRHGDTFTRRPKVDKQKTELLHFRPEKDDVVVYSPDHDEIRINARTRGERELYRRQFGRLLRGEEDYFAARKRYTLEPLRAEGADALDPKGLEGIGKIVLREVEIEHGNQFNERLVKQADDLFQCAEEGGEELIPRKGRLARAVFAVHFTGSRAPRPVQIRPPNLLKLGRHCDARLVDRWLWRRGFRVGEMPAGVAEERAT